MRLAEALRLERLSPVPTLAAAVAALVLAVASVIYGHVAASPVAPWFSILFSAAAVACTIISVLLTGRR